MSNMLTASVTVKGVRPLLWNAFTPDAIPLTKTEKTGVAGNNPIEWRRSVLVTAENQLYVWSTYLFGCLRDGAKHTRRGRGTLQSLVAATLQVLDERVLTNRYLPSEDELTEQADALVYLDVRSVKNPITRGRNVRYRIAAAPGWMMTFRLQWDRTIVSRQEMEAVAIDAGRLVGLGDGRTIGLGRFDVEAFTVSEEGDDEVLSQ